MLKIVKYLLPLTFVSFLVSCGGSSDNTNSNTNTDSNPSTNLTGTFLDAAVEGITVERRLNSAGGLVVPATHTNADGEFTYQADEVLTFRIGNLIFAEHKTVPEDGMITPLYLVNGITDTRSFEAGSSSITMNATVTLMLQVLQSLDNDGFLGNGIRISTQTRADLRHDRVTRTILTRHSSSRTLLRDLGRASRTIINSSGTIKISNGRAVNHFRGTLIQERRGRDGKGDAETSSLTISGRSHRAAQSQINYISRNHANYFSSATKTEAYRPPEFTAATSTNGGTLTWTIYGQDATRTQKMQEHIEFMSNRLSNSDGLARFTRRFDKLFVIQVAVKDYFTTATDISGAASDTLTVTKYANNSCVYQIIYEHAISIQDNFFRPAATASIKLTSDGSVTANSIISSSACQAPRSATVLMKITEAVDNAWTKPSRSAIPIVPHARTHDHSTHTDPSSPTHSGNRPGSSSNTISRPGPRIPSIVRNNNFRGRAPRR